MSEIKNNLKPVSALNPLNQGPMAEKRNQVTEEKFREVSSMYEKYFIREMMKEMRSTVQESGFIKKNNAERIFQDQLDDQYTDQWGKAGGIGLSQLIFDQLMSRYGEMYGLKQKMEKPQGPLSMNDKAEYTGRVLPKSENSQSATTIQLQSLSKTSEPLHIQNPWAGILLDKKYLEMDHVAYRIKHDNGLESLIMTRGSGRGGQQTLSPGDRIASGQDLGLHSPESPVLWTVKPDSSQREHE